jgi:adenylate kinase family enzyme
MFDYFTSYWLTSGDWLDRLVLSGASDRGTEAGLSVWHFWQSDEAPKTDFDIPMRDLKKHPDGVVTAISADGNQLTFTPVTVDMVRQHPDRFGLSDATLASLKTQGDVYLVLHAAEVPETYAQEYGPPSAQNESVTPVVFDFDEARGEEAPVGTVHFWASRDSWFKKQPNGSWLHLGAGMEWTDANPDLPTDTLKAHTTPDGVLTSERQRLHKTILDDVFRGKKRVRNPVAVITMGMPASGKSTLARYLAENPDELAVLDADAHRTKLPEYQAAVATKARNGAIITHSEVSNLNDTAIDLAMSEDPDSPGEYYPFLLDGVGTSTAYYKGVIKEARSKGYDVKLVLAHVRDTDDMTGLDAVRIRAEDRGVRFGRFVKPEIFPAARIKLPASFAELAPEASSAIVVDVTDPTAPKQMFAQAGNDTVGNPNWMEESMKKPMTAEALLALYAAATKWEAEQLAKTAPTFKPGEGTEDPGIDAVPESKQG